MYNNVLAYSSQLGIATTYDSHLIKNSEWGTVAYLSRSKYGTTHVKLSSTGTVYGIYDLAGSAWEYTAAFNAEYSGGTYFTGADYLPASGNHFASYHAMSSKYATAYANNSSNYYPTETIAKTGDATWEFYSSTQGRAWNNDYANFLSSSNPFFKRGGNYNNGSNAGVSYANNNTGNANENYDFRAVLSAL